MNDIRQKDYNYMQREGLLPLEDHIDQYGDIDFSGGDLHFAESDNQQFRDILIIQKGELKHRPSLGVNIHNYIDDENKENLIRDIRKNLSRDGATIDSIRYNDKLTIDARY